MTKIMLQIGTLAFFVSAVFFGSQGLILMDILTRSFIVFIGVVAGQAVLLMATAAMKNKRTPEPDLAPVADSGEAAESGQQAGQRTQTAS
jgi:hypothetical protein